MFISRSVRRVTALASAMLLAVLASVPTAAVGPDQDVIVVFREGSVASRLAEALGRSNGFLARYVYSSALQGFSARVSAGALIALRAHPEVATVELDGTAYPLVDQTNATWGLDRIDQRALPLNTTYVYNQTGTGVTAYVIDTGIHFSHSQFGGRASPGADFVAPSLNGDDCNGHGTHVAGTIGGSTYGVAKGVTLRSVRVFGCTGGAAWSTIIAAVDWVTADHQPGAPAVANMSLGGGAYSAVDAAVTGSIADGVSYAIAAGNSNADACNYSPARVTNAMTVGATGSNDARASFSNYGNCVDFFAPGVNITSSWYSSNTATNTISGTSMATPHTAGVAALYLQLNPAASPAAVRTALFDATTKGIVTSSNSTNNHLLYSLDLGAPAPPPSPPGDTGQRSPTANAAASGGDGNGFQTNPGSAYTDDGVVAVDTNSGTSTFSSSCTSSTKDKHVFNGYDLTSIPAAAVVKGIEVRLDASVDSTSGSPKLCVQLSWDGGVSWTSAKSTATLATTESTRLLGNATDTWGRSWAVGNFSSASFRVRVISVANSTSRDFSLDWVAVRVYY